MLEKLDLKEYEAYKKEYQVSLYESLERETNLSQTLFSL